MNVPVKLIKNQLMNENFTFHQSIAKKYHKVSSKGKRIPEQVPLLENESLTFKEEVINWVFNLPFKERIKALSIENKWLASMVFQMNRKFNSDNKLKYQIKNDSYNDEELFLTQYIGMGQQNYSYSNNMGELSLDAFFNVKSESYSREVCFSEKLFLHEVVFYSLREANDCFGLSPDLITDRRIFTYNFDHFSESKCFSNYCSVSYDQNLKIYTWNYPDWFKYKEYNTVAEFIIAYLEQMLCVRYWYYKEDKEKMSKGQNSSISISDDSVFNELFDNRNKLINYLKEEFPEKNLFKAIDLKRIIVETRNDPSVTNKIVKPQFSSKDYFFFYKQFNGETIDPLFFENENDIIKKLTDSYLKGEQKLIDDLIFTAVDKVSSLEDFSSKQIYAKLMNMYAEKNANDLMLNLELDGNFSKKNKKKRKANKKKTKSRSESLCSNSKGGNLNVNVNGVNISNISNVNNSNSKKDKEKEKEKEFEEEKLIKEHHKDTVFLKVNSIDNQIQTQANKTKNISDDFNNSLVKSQEEEEIPKKNQGNSKESRSSSFSRHSKSKSLITNIVNEGMIQEMIITYNPNYQLKQDYVKLNESRSGKNFNQGFSQLDGNENEGEDEILDSRVNRSKEIEKEGEKEKEGENHKENHKEIDKDNEKDNESSEENKKNEQKPNTEQEKINEESEITSITNETPMTPTINPSQSQLPEETTTDTLNTNTNQKKAKPTKKEKDKNNFFLFSTANNKTPSKKNKKPKKSSQTPTGNTNQTTQIQESSLLTQTQGNTVENEENEEIQSQTNSQIKPIKESRMIQTSDNTIVNNKIEIVANHEIVKSKGTSNLNKKMVDNYCQTDIKKTEINENAISFSTQIEINANNVNKFKSSKGNLGFQNKKESQTVNSTATPVNSISNNQKPRAVYNNNKSYPQSNNNNNFLINESPKQINFINSKKNKEKEEIDKIKPIQLKEIIEKERKEDYFSNQTDSQVNNSCQINENNEVNNENEQSSFVSSSSKNNSKGYKKKGFGQYNSYNKVVSSNKFNHQSNVTYYNQRSNESSKNFFKSEKQFFNNRINYKSNDMFNLHNNTQSQYPANNHKEILTNFSKAFSFTQQPNQFPEQNLPQHNYYIYNSHVNFNNSVSLSSNSNGFLSSDNFSPINTNNNTASSSHKQNTWTKKQSKDENILKKINTDENSSSNLIFSHKLHNDILDYSNNIKKILQDMKQIKEFIVKLVNLLISISTNQEYETELYGSFATELSIESSDVDILIKVSSESFDPEAVINKICIFLASTKLFENITPIATASIPIIKLCIDPEKLFSIQISNTIQKSSEIKELISENQNLLLIYKSFLSSETVKSYSFDVAELQIVKLDLSFYNQNVLGDSNVVEYVKNQIRLNQEITPLVHVIKRFLSLNKLNSSFNGGLSSFSLLLMIIAYLKYPKTSNITNLGLLLTGFLEFYGKYFNFNQFVIDVSNFNPILMTNDFLEVPIVVDPTTRKNVAKNSFRIEEVKEVFSLGFDYIQEQKIKYDKRSIKSTMNFIIDLYYKATLVYS